MSRAAKQGQTVGDVLVAATEKLKRGNPTGSNQHETKEESCDSRNSSQVSRAKENGVSVWTQGRIDRLSVDRPDLFARVNAGELSATGKPKRGGDHTTEEAKCNFQFASQSSRAKENGVSRQTNSKISGSFQAERAKEETDNLSNSTQQAREDQGTNSTLIRGQTLPYLRARLARDSS
jgi:hypothetical protein